jgi:hypothetical protein
VKGARIKEREEGSEEWREKGAKETMMMLCQQS